MNLSFRQGLISFQSGAFLTPSNTNGYIDLSVTPTPFIGTIAHGSSDYLIRFDATVAPAWGPLQPGLDNYLFLELNLITGAITHGITTREPISSTVEPTVGIVAGQMWFDLTEKVFKVRSNDNTKWIVSPRLVVGYAENGSTNGIQMYSAGTRVGLNEQGRPGYFMLDSQLRPLRTSTGELLTQATPVRVKTTVGTAGVLAEPMNTFIPARADQPIPALRLVYFSGSDSISLASSDPSLTSLKTPVGIVQHALATNEVGTVVQNGVITSDQFNWASTEIGKPLYCGFAGEITTSRPQSILAYRVGYVKNANSMLFDIDAETAVQVAAAEATIISGVPPLNADTAPNALNENVTTISMTEADSLHDGYLTSVNYNTFTGFGTRITDAEANIVDLQTNKADVTHTQPIDSVIGLTSALDVLTAAVDSKATKAIPAVAGTFPSLTAQGDLVDSLLGPSSFALALHTHPISEVTNLQTVLDGKSNVGHTHVITDTTGLQAALDAKAAVNHSHTIANVTGLQTALDNKAPLVHSHIITDVTGLQEALDAKAAFVHLHEISDVNGLQLALNGKANTVHTHAIADTTGLQAALDGKASLAHTHVSSDVTDFGEAVDDRVSTLLQAGAGISLQYLDGSNQLVIASTGSAASLLLTSTDASGTLVTSEATSDLVLSPQFQTNKPVGQPRTISIRPLNIYEGGTLRMTYPSSLGNALTEMKLVFGTGLTATVSGTNDSVVTVNSVAPTSLDALDDVVLTSPTSNEVLSFNGSEWVNSPLQIPQVLKNLNDVDDLLAPGEGQVLMFTSGQWTAGSVNVPTVLMNLDDVANEVATSGQILKFNGTEWAPGYESITTLASLTDVANTVPTPGQVLTFDGSQWIASNAATAGASTLASLTDVSIPSPISGQVLKYNGGQWVAAADNAPVNLSDLNDVASTAPTTGQVLKFNGTEWAPGIDSAPAVLAELTDVSDTAPVAGQVLKYNGTEWAPGAVQVPQTIDELTDVDTTTVAPTVGQVLAWTGSTWAPATVASGGSNLTPTTTVTFGTPIMS